MTVDKSDIALMVIRRISRSFEAPKAHPSVKYPYGVVLEATIESALITWLGLVLFGITCLAPQGKITV